jgi:hypothetical protein
MDPKRVDEIYEQMGKFSIELPPDAWALGPKHIHDMISLTRGYTNSVSHVLQEILQERQTLDRGKHAVESVFKMESDRLLAEDDRVRRLPNIADREATVNLILRERRTEIQDLEGLLLDLSYVEKAVKHRYNELKSTMSDIRAQRALIRDAIDTGSFYGDETETSRGSSRLSGSRPTSSDGGGLSEDDIDKSMRELDTMMVTGEQPPEPVAQAKVSPVVPQPVVAQPQPVVPSPPADDFSDLIDGVEDVPSPVASPVAPPSSVEDPEITRFLDGTDELEDLFSDELQSV